MARSGSVSTAARSASHDRRLKVLERELKHLKDAHERLRALVGENVDTQQRLLEILEQVKETGAQTMRTVEEMRKMLGAFDAKLDKLLKKI